MSNNLLKSAVDAANELDAAQVFLATVSSTSGNRIKVTRPGQSVADNTFYAAASGLAAAIVAGNTVLMLRAGASYVAVCKVVT